MGRVLRFLLGDQLSRSVSSLDGLDPAADVVVMAELADEAGYVRHHKRKIAFVFSAMRHFASALDDEGITVDYRRYDAGSSVASFTDALLAAVERHRPDMIVVTEPGEWRVEQMLLGWSERTGLPVEIRPDRRFLCSRERFARWAARYPAGPTMEYFYREMRRGTGLLMAGGKPEGGRWNLDTDNRSALPKGAAVPVRPSFPPDEATTAVLDLVATRFADHFGALDGFDHPVTRDDALVYLDWFIEHALPGFGTYQDAMKEGEPLLYHSHLSALMNCGLLLPEECCRAAERAWHEGAAPLNAVEGFIRQIIGWREYVRGIYWTRMPGYGEENALHATRPLPWFFWTGETAMNCCAQAIGETRANAYAHHIQRLMVIGNFCLLAGIEPKAVQEWFLIVYHDAYEWVEMPNVVGMILHADGGYMASKPYAASGAYIDRMSDYCGRCRYDVKQKTGPKACPFNYLYWDFLDRNRGRLADNRRLAMPYRTLDRLAEDRLETIRRDARTFLEGPALSPDGTTHF
jgi:deoxyribodipyrimidine photolyase-related protein